MRRRTKSNSPIYRSEINGVVNLDTADSGENIVKVTGGGEPGEQREYPFSRFDQLAVKSGDEVEAGQPLVKRHDTLWDRFGWRVKPFNLVREMLMKLDETHKWVNLSDGGHIENLGTYELLRRRCKYIVVCDAEQDPDMALSSLGRLTGYARMDLGVFIRWPHADLLKKDPESGNSRSRWTIGDIYYDDCGEPTGHILYIKSSVDGSELADIQTYRAKNPDFPQQSTADQFFESLRIATGHR